MTRKRSLVRIQYGPLSPLRRFQCDSVSHDPAARDMNPMMRRIWQFIAVLVIGGAIINLAIVAVITLVTSRGSWASVVHHGTLVPAEDSIIYQRFAHEYSDGEYWRSEARGIGWRNVWANSSAQPILGGSEQEFFRCRVFQAGWPLRAMEGELRMTGQGLQSQIVHGIGQTRLAAGEFDSDIFPLKPLWVGFTGNTLIFGVVAWLAIVFLRQIVVRSRVRCGCCPACGYDLRAGPRERCPECGAAMGTRQESPAV